MKNISRVVVVCAAALFCNPANAGLNIPYAADANTLHLWHFDEALTNEAGVTNILSADAVISGGITLTNAGEPTNSWISLNPAMPAPPYTNTQLGAPGSPGMGNAYQATSLNAMMYGGQFPDASPFYNTNSGAFTFEALVNFDVPFTANLPNAMEVVCGDTSVAPNTAAIRGWQWQINAGRQMEFNLLGGSGSDNDWKANLPLTGSDAVVQGHWYHMAVTFTGLSPTNGDPPGVLNFYWTPVDGSRSNANLLATFHMTRNLNGSATVPPIPANGTVTPGLGIGGNARNYPGTLANGEGVIGLVDEVRLSNIARGSNQMAFIPGGTFPAVISAEPPTNTLLGWGQTLTLVTLLSGTSVTGQWQFTNTSGGGFTNIPTRTNSALVISNIDFPAAGAYRLVITNFLGGKTSSVANVTVGAALSELFNTGVTAGGVPSPGLAGAPDLHYSLAQSSDIGALGPAALVWSMTALPIATAGGNFSPADNDSQWTGEVENGGSPAGPYTYRTYFLLDSVDVTRPVTLRGRWFENEIGNDILLNGQSTGNSLSSAGSASGKFSAAFTITNGFVAGLNTLDFVTTRSATAPGGYTESAVRVEFSSSVGQALPPGLPQILQNPAPETVSDASATGVTDTVKFSVVAMGCPPISYRWLGNSNSVAIPGATHRTLSYVGPTAGAQPTNFSCMVSNFSGAITSAVASLTLLSTNPNPMLENFGTFQVYSNQVFDLNFNTLASSATDVNGFQLFPDINNGGFDPAGTNGLSTITLVGNELAYTPGAGALGADAFNYYLQDAFGAVGTGTITINVVAPLLPALSAALTAGSGIVLGGAGGAPGGDYHVLSSTNIAAALTNWVSSGPFTFDGSGDFSVTNSATNAPQTFYIISVP